jgi:hypothetical protein
VAYHHFGIPFILAQLSITYPGLAKHFCRAGKSHLTSSRAGITPIPILTCTLGIMLLCCIFFIPKVPDWGTGRAELEKLEPIYTLITEYYDFLLKSNSADTSIDHTLFSISAAQMAHLIEPVFRQRDDQARLANCSR